jgi:NADH-quinone oxidoreductase subunit A
LGGYGLAVILIFSAAVFESFLYLISNGALDWGPVKQLRRSSLLLASDRTTETTIRRVGAVGRETDQVSSDGDVREVA